MNNDDVFFFDPSSQSKVARSRPKIQFTGQRRPIYNNLETKVDDPVLLYYYIIVLDRQLVSKNVFVIDGRKMFYK